MLPGEHIVVLGRPENALDARISNLQLRDTLLVLFPGPRVLFAYLFRTPLEDTVAENVLKYGYGGLNIDVCRIHSGPSQGKSATCKDKGGGNWGVFNDDRWRPKPLPIDRSMAKGRWPTNLLLVHGPGCVRVGEKKVRGGTARRLAGVSNQVAYGGNIGRLAPGTPDLGYVGSDGLETVPAWACQPDCPVRLLDEQSGRLKSGDPTGAVRNEGGNMLLGQGKGVPLTGYGDAGGASRFYPQFGSFPEALDWITKLIGTP